VGGPRGHLGGRAVDDGSRLLTVRNSRLANTALLGLLTVAFATGWVAFELSGQPARAVLVLHAAAGVGIVLLVPWKSLIARRGLRARRSMKWASIALAVGVLVSLAFGFVHSSGRPDVGSLTAMDFHVGAAICVIPFVLWHVMARPAKLRAADLTRRNFLKGAALLGVSGLGVALLPGARRATTGSFQSDRLFATQWMFDTVPSIDAATWRLTVAGSTLTYQQLAGFGDHVTAVLDCTGGWYSEQEWEGVWLSRILPPAAAAASSLNVRSVTGYSRRFAIGAASRLLVATRVGGSPLEPGNGYPVRLVVQGRRGFEWVKWVAAIDADERPWWWQPPFPLQ
jgi:molybdopterin-dependent oxidoreductase-like protein protein